MRTKIINFIIFIFISVTAFSSSLYIEGNKKLSNEDIQKLTNVDIKSQDLNDIKINQLINDLYKSELIDNLIIKSINNNYYLEIIENNLINKIYINGNSSINDENILLVLKSKDNSLFDKSKILNDINVIKKLYSSRGFNNVNIVTSAEKFSEDKLNLIFDIYEGDKSYISNIQFLGNSFFSNNFLSSKINSETKSFFNFFDKSSNFTTELFNFDVNTIKNLYLDKGFFNVDVNYTLEKNGFNSYVLNFYIEENQRYKINNFIYNDEFKSKYLVYLEPLIENFEKKIKKNDLFFDKELISEHIINLNNILFDNNLSNLKISPIYTFSNSSMDILFDQSFSKNEIINKININGNKITQDNVIRSKLIIEPGDLFIKEKIEKQIRLLKNYKYINDATYSFSKNDNSDLNIDLNENLKTGSFFFAATASSDLGFGLNFGINDFNVFGSGNQISADFSINTEKVIFDLNFIQYPYLSSNLRNSFSISNVESDYTSSFGFKTNEQKISAGITFDYSENISMSGNISYLSIDGSDPKFPNDIAVSDNVGLNNDFILKYSINYDTINNFLYPTNGFSNSIAFEYSPQSISDNSYIKSILSNKNYFEISKEGSFLFNTNSFGAIESLDSSKIKTFNAFSLGGSSFNGFNYRGVGSRNDNNIYLGGNKFITSKIGFGTNFFTKQQDNLYLKIFLTTGSIWDGDYDSSKYRQRTSLGGSLDFLTPIGPISISYALPIEKSDKDNVRRLDLRIGGIF